MSEEIIQQPISIKFENYKVQIITALQSKDQTKLGFNENTQLVDGFFNQPISMELNGNFIIGGPTIPMIAVVGMETGRIYFFALKILLPNIEI
jgi:hypothetical protein